MKPEKINDLIPPASGPPDFDLLDFSGEIQEMEISDAQAEQILQALWPIMYTAAQIGWGVDIVQIMLPQLFSEVANDNDVKKKGSEDE